MKTLLFLFLISCAFCNQSIEESVNLESNILDIVKCFVEKTIPLEGEIFELLAAIEEQDILKVIVLAQGLYSKITEITDQCMNVPANLTLNIAGIIRCLTNLKSTKQIVKDLISDLKSKRGFFRKLGAIAKFIFKGGKAIAPCILAFI